MTNKIHSPCKDCRDRFVGCHSKCGKYNAFRVKVAEFYATKAKMDYAHDPMSGYLRDRKAKRLHAESRKSK